MRPIGLVEPVGLEQSHRPILIRSHQPLTKSVYSLPQRLKRDVVRRVPGTGPFRRRTRGLWPLRRSI
jgi:hypothetical protein